MTTEPVNLQAVTDVPVSAPDRVREAVVEAARKLFSERGIHAVSVREIAREVGVSHTLLHLYFGNKEEIVRQVFKRYESGLTADMIEDDPAEVAAARLFLNVANDPSIARVLGAALVEGMIPHGLDGQLQKVFAEKMSERADGVDPRVVSVALSAMMLGWAVGSEWLFEEAGIPESDREAAIGDVAQLVERMVRGCLK